MVQLPSVVMTALYLAYVAVTVVSTNERTPLWAALEAALTLAVFLATAGWLFGAARIAASPAQGLTQKSMPILTVLLALFALAGVAISALVFAYRFGSPAELNGNPVVSSIAAVGGVSLLISSWLTSDLISRAELQAGKRSSRIGVFLSLLYLVVGVWWLRPRVLQIAGSRA